MNYLNVFSKREFAVDGKMKQSWNRVGVIRISKTGKMYLNLYFFPTTEFYLFEPNEQTPHPQSQT